MTSERTYFLKIGLLWYLVWFVLFEAVGNYAAMLPTRDLTSFIDRQIPLIPTFVWPYVLCYVMPFLLLFLVNDGHRFNRALLALLLSSLSGFLIYLALPLAFPRPELGLSLSERMLDFVYRIDFYPGANKLPSGHVATSWIVYFACRKQRLNRYGDALLFALAALISISTLFVKQHIVYDVVAGMVWSVGAWLGAGWLYPRLTDIRLAAPVALKQAAKKVGLILLGFSVTALLVGSIQGCFGPW